MLRVLRNWVMRSPRATKKARSSSEIDMADVGTSCMRAATRYPGFYKTMSNILQNEVCWVVSYFYENPLDRVLAKGRFDGPHREGRRDSGTVGHDGLVPPGLPSRCARRQTRRAECERV